jgi:2-succinyl-5-enolpyruvyl-6-hydroxy-3-cyclohexene-1-carboxylate synthase
MSLGDVSLACASVVVDELARSGMHDACLSPGSRSTPIALALDRHPEITLHVHLDERSSAFFALGLSKATGRPVAAACTSGTATAEFLPAVVEAFQSRVQLILLTADRPPRLRGTGANQTIDQVRLYGTYAAYVELPLPEEPVPDGRLRMAVMDAMRGAAFPRIPVHLNMPFDEPLMPEDIEVAIDETPAPEILADPAQFRRPVEEAEALAREASGRRGVVLIGGMIDASTADDLALVANLLHRRSDLHIAVPDYVDRRIRRARRAISALRPYGFRGHRRYPTFSTILPRRLSTRDSSTRTRSPTSTRMKLRSIRSATCATMCEPSSRRTR